MSLLRTLAVTLLLFALTAPLSAQKLEGMASFYGDKFDGRPTSTGEIFRKTGFSAASLDLPWGTVVEVTNLSNGKTTQVRVNDCGPHARGRIIDLSRAAAEDLDMIKGGETKVRLRILQASTSGPTCKRGAWAKQLKAQGKAIPPPPAPWDPTKTVAIKPVNPVVIGNQGADPARPVPTGATRGRASYYPTRLDGRPTSTGETYDPAQLTAASKAFPYGTRLAVTNVTNGREVTVRINDCGPASPDRILDLSRAAADRIDLTRAGIAMVDVRVVELGDQGPTCDRAAWLAEQREGAAKPAPGRLPTTVALNPEGSDPAPVTFQPENLVDAYCVQVGAFSKFANAAKLKKELIDLGFTDAYVRRDNDLTKVYAGVTDDQAVAAELKQELLERNFTKVSVKPTKAASDQLIRPTEAPVPAPGPATYGSPVTPEPVPATTAKSPEPTFSPDDILFGVQVGAFSTKAAAEKAAEKLRAAGFSMVYTAAVGKVHRVFSGKYYFQHQAEAEKKRLREAGFSGATVRRVQ